MLEKDKIAKVDKDPNLKYLNASTMLGFGLWWAMLLLGSFLPDEDISETGRMWLLIITMSYAVLVVGAIFWSGYSKKERELVNADPLLRRKGLAQLARSAIFGFIFMLLIGLYMMKEPLTGALLKALFFAAFTSLVTYFMSLRKPKQGAV